MNALPVLRCENVHRTFSLDKKGGSQVQVLKGIDMTIWKGELIAIVGASGSGKSTLLHILGGLDAPNEGKVYWHETEVTSLSLEMKAKLRGKTVGFVFQFHHLLKEFSTLENVMLPMLIRGETMKNAREKAEKLLQRFSLVSRGEHKPNELSGGEQQRVAIARALANSPDILLADEPTGNLDVANSVQLYQILLELNKKDNLTTVIVTHNKELAAQCNKTYQLADGKLHLL